MKGKPRGTARAHRPPASQRRFPSGGAGAAGLRGGGAGAAALKQRAAAFAGFFNQNQTRDFKAEEEILFPFMRASIPESSALIDDLLADHARLRALLAPLAGDTGLAKHLFDAGDLLERHIRREERELFPLFEKHAAASDAEKLGSELGAILG